MMGKEKPLIRLLHLADFHINAPFLREDEHIRKGLKEGLSLAFSSMMKQALTLDVDAVIFAGDMFDAPPKSLAIQSMMVKWMHQLSEKGIAIYYISGNHDFGKVMDVPEGVHYAHDGQTNVIDAMSKSGEKYRVVMTGHEAKKVDENRLVNWPDKKDDVYTIGVGHCAVSGIYASEREQGYMPVALRELEGLHYDYIALGHIHQQQKVGNSGRIYYAGNGMGLDRTELGKKGGLLVTLEGSDINVTPLYANTIERKSITVDVSLMEDTDSLLELLKKEKLSSNDYVYVTLTGQSKLYHSLADRVSIQTLTQFLVSQLHVFHLRLDGRQVLPKIDLGPLKEENTVLAIGLKLLDDDACMEKFMAMSTMIDRYPNPQMRRQYILSLMETMPLQWVSGFIGGESDND